jgi:NTE family protein
VTRVVCALSGGGAKAAAHLGALKALGEHGLTPEHYVATSMGAVVAAALAAGVSYEECLMQLARLRRRDVAVLSPKIVLGYYSESLLLEGPLRRTIAALVPAEGFDELLVPLTVTIVDVESGELELLGEGGREDVPLHDALYATCALPIYFPPAVIDGRKYVDGGLRASLPIDVALLFEPELIFAVDVGPSFTELPPDRDTPLPPLVRRHGEVVRVMMAAQTRATIACWNREASAELVLVRPLVQAETTFRLDMVVHYVEEGYRAAIRTLSARVPR